MGGDGAKGLLAMKNKGAYTLGQSKETCVVYGMPMVAKEMGAVSEEFPPAEISKRVYRWYGEKI